MVILNHIDNYDKNALQKYDISSYPQFPFSELKKEISKYWFKEHTFNENCIKFGTGSIGILVTINKMFIEKGTKVLGVGPTFHTISFRCKTI